MQFKAPSNLWEITHVSAMLLVVGVVFGYGIGPFLLKFSIGRVMRLTQGLLPIRNTYLEVPFPLKQKIHIYNITNPEGILNGETPIVQDVGPYVFDFYIKKEVIEEDELGDTITFDERRFFYFNAKETLPLTGDEIITTPHLIYAGGVTRTFRDMPDILDFIQEGLQDIFSDLPSIFMELRAYDILWDGMDIDCDKTDFSAKAVCAAIGAEKVEKVDEKHFKASLFKQDNATVYQRVKVKRGTQNILDFNRIVEVNDMEENDLYDGDFCNRLNGFDGSFFHPLLKKSDTLEWFVKETCRILEYKTIGKRVWHGMIPTQRFKRVSFNDKLGDNSCFCTGSVETCPLEGIIDGSICTQLPAVFSEAHGLHADQRFHDMVKGMEPNEEIHSSIFDIHLKTGSQLYSRNTFQVNLDLEPIEGDKYLSKMPTVYLPYIWLEIEVDNKDTAHGLMFTASLGSFIILWIKWICIIFGVTGLVGSQVMIQMNRAGQ